MLKSFIHCVVLYALLVFLMRLIGKRQLGELELPELIVTFLISEAASEPIINPSVPIMQVLVPILTLLALEYLLSVVAMKSVRLRGILTGKPALLITHGKIDQKQMRKNRITPDELCEALRNDGILDLGSVEYAILESNGIGIQTEDAGYPMIVVNNGRVLAENLRLLGFDESWLQKRLSERNVSGPQQVYMMTADRLGRVYLAENEGQD